MAKLNEDQNDGVFVPTNQQNIKIEVGPVGEIREQLDSTGYQNRTGQSMGFAISSLARKKKELRQKQLQARHEEL